MEFSKAILNINRPIACRFTVISYLASGFVGRDIPSERYVELIQDEYHEDEYDLKASNIIVTS